MVLYIVQTPSGPIRPQIIMLLCSLRLDDAWYRSTKNKKPLGRKRSRPSRAVGNGWPLTATPSLTATLHSTLQTPPLSLSELALRWNSMYASMWILCWLCIISEAMGDSSSTAVFLSSHRSPTGCTGTHAVDTRIKNLWHIASSSSCHS